MTNTKSELVERLLSRKFIRERWVEPVGTMAEPCDEDDEGAEAILRNPDGPEAAATIQSQAERIEMLERAVAVTDENVEKVERALCWADTDASDCLTVCMVANECRHFGRPGEPYSRMAKAALQSITALSGGKQG